MLRSSIRSVRQSAGLPAVRQVGPVVRRYFASEPTKSAPKSTGKTVKSVKSTTPASTVAAKVAAATATAAASPTTPAVTTVKSIPVPPPPPPSKVASTVTTPPTPPSPPPPVAPKKPGFLRRLRNFVFRLALLGVIGFASGVWYSRINDDFHDFFTEYVPLGEQAVLYLEEQEFRKRFTEQAGRVKPHDATVSIPAQSGASWRVADTETSTRRAASGPAAIVKKAETKTKEVAQKVAANKEEVKKEAPKVVKVVKVVKAAPANAKKEAEFVPPQVDEPSRRPPVPKIDLLTMKNAEDPIVQDLVHIVNDIIVVINADNAQARYGSSINKAKEGVNAVLDKIEGIKSAAKASAKDEVASKVVEFEKAADALVQRVEQVMLNQELVWRQEFETEMERIQKTYDDKIALLQDREQKLAAERLNAQLLEQAVSLKRQFTQDVKAQVEVEREGRLAKLHDLSQAVEGLEKLASGWNQVVDSNLKTQQLHVAVEAVRASLEKTQHSKPFVSELVALKEIAAEDPVVDAAVASITPSAYQRGIASPSELVDRFRRVATEVRKASLLPEDAGVASHASSLLLSKVMFKKTGLADGDDVESILTRAQTYLEEGDLDNAAREVNGLQGWAKTLSRDWLGEVRKVLEVQQALDVISTEARLQSLRLEQQQQQQQQ